MRKMTQDVYMGRVASAVVVALSGLGMAAFVGASSAPSSTEPARPAIARTATVSHPQPARCTRPAPTSAAGFAALWASLPQSVWGAADVSISVPLGNGRSVWLYGDTLSTGRFVHSTAITQDRGCLHVSRGGAQLLPNDDASHIYWIYSARAVDSRTLRIAALAITITGKGAWDFRYAGHMRTALATVSPSGDVTFVRWVRDVRRPMPDPGPMYRLDDQPHHFGYARVAHPEFRLASGRTLVTICQNWDDGVLHPLPDYRPIFSER